MLKEIKKNIKKYRKVKYQKIIFSKKEINQRNKAIKYVLNLNSQNQIYKKKCQSCKFYSTYLNEKNFISFYKKFNSKIQLKEKYDVLTLKEKTNKSACFKSYILFSKFLMENKEINNIHKLNTILKINDLLILMFKKNKHLSLIKNFKENIKYEKKLMNLYL